MATQHEHVTYEDQGYAPATALFSYQKQALALAEEREAYAWFLEMGLGKTAIAIANAGRLHKQGKLTGVLVLAPKGVHRQWVDEQLPIHIDRTVKCHGIVWKGVDIPTAAMDKPGLTWFTMNVDALKHKGFGNAQRFLELHHGRSMVIADESQLFKNHKAKRTTKFLELAPSATYRRLCSGTPIANGVMDLFTQFQFLDERILGHKYITAYQREYCIMGGYNFREVKAYKNIEKLYALIAPHSYRMTKEEALDLPPKIYATRAYAMGEPTKQHYNELKRTYMTWLKDGTIVDVPNAAVCLLRLQQVLCGYLPNEDGKLMWLSDERLEVLCEIVEQTEGGMVVWARFIEDAYRITKRLEARYGKVALYRENDTERAAAKQAYMQGKARFFVANPASGGTGLDGLQHTTRSVVYYSNDFNALHRWQSEARTDRIGTTGSVRYFDIVAEGSVDRHILAALRSKKSVSDLTLDQIRQAVAGA